MADSRTEIPRFMGAVNQSWVFKLQSGFVEEELHTGVCDFNGRVRKPCPTIIERLRGRKLQLLPAGVIIASKARRDVDVAARNAKSRTWKDLDL